MCAVISFTEQTFEDLQRAIKDIESKVPGDKLKGFVLDLRLNPGGLLDQAVAVSDAFLDKGEVVSTRGRDPQDITRFDARARRSDQRQAADRHDQWRFGQCFRNRGRRAPGSSPCDRPRHALLRQGLAYRRSSRSAKAVLLRLTTALYYTPAGKSIQGKGIVPDIAVEQPLPAELQGAGRHSRRIQI